MTVKSLATAAWKKAKDRLPTMKKRLDYQDKVDELKKRITTTDIPELLNVLKEVKIEKSVLDAKSKALNIDIAAYDQILVDRFEEEGITKMEDASGVSFVLEKKPQSSCKDRAKLFAWIKKTKQEEILTVNSRTLSGIVKDRLINGLPAPPGVEVFNAISIQVKGLKGTTASAEKGEDE